MPNIFNDIISLTDNAGLLVLERVQLGGYLVDEPGRVPSALGELVGHAYLDRSGPQEPFHLAHGELHQPVPFRIFRPLFRRELERAGRSAAVAVTVVAQPDHAYVLVEPVRVPDEELVQSGQGAGLETFGHVALQARAVGRRQVRVAVLVRETAQPIEQVLAVARTAGTVAAAFRKRSVIVVR